MKNNINSPTLVDQDKALSSYMDSLLGVSNNSARSIIGEPQAATTKEVLSASEQATLEQPTRELPSNDKSALQADISINTQLETPIDSQLSITAKNTDVLAQTIVDDKQAPRLDLSLFLPEVPSTEELELIEKKEQIQLNHELQQKLDKSKKVNHLLKGKLEESLKKISDFAKTHTELYAPEWAQPSFQIILFNVGNLKLALPLNDLNSIVAWDDKYITQLPGSREWYLGLIQYQAKSIPVIDTLQKVIPANKLNNFVNKRGDFKHIVIIDDESWGLVCEDIIGIRTIAVEDVKWRSSRTSRKWLLGTVKEHMCALLDTSEFTAMLRTGEGSLTD